MCVNFYLRSYNDFFGTSICLYNALSFSWNFIIDISIYFVAETKGSMKSMQLRLVEKSKIHCAREHFKAISNGNVVYDVVDSYSSLLDIIKS